MFEVRVKAGFSASHQLRLYDGQLEPLHGHDWEVEAVFRGGALDGIDVLVDFVAAQRALDGIAGELHHGHLNELEAFAGVNPSAERVAMWVYGELLNRLGNDWPLAAVYVKEAPGCVAGYIAE